MMRIRTRYRIWVTVGAVMAVLYARTGWAASASSSVKKRGRPVPINAPGKPANTARQAPAKQDYFSRAKAYFVAGRYEFAIQYAAADLRRFPDRKASTILMAQSYYRLGHAGRAVRLFQTVSLDDLSANATVDYTLAMFAKGRYKAVVKSWRKVPDNHPYRDIVKFYAGVSYMHLNLYDRASQLLRTAKKLPANLKSDRRRLLTEVDNFLERQRQGQFIQDRGYAYQLQQRYYVAPPVEPTAQPGPAPATPAVPTTPPPKAGFAYSATPKVSYTSVSTKTDNNGYSLNQSSARTQDANMALQLQYSGKPRSFGAQPSVTVKVTPGYSDTDNRGTKSSLSSPEGNSSIVQSETSFTEGNSFTQTLASAIDGVYPVSDPLDIGAGYKDERSYPFGNTSSETATSGPNAKLTYEADVFKTDLAFSMYDNTNRTLPDPRVSTVTTTQGTLTRNGENTVTKLKGTYVTTDAVAQSGEQTRMAADLDWSRTWDDLTLGLLAGYVSREAYPGTVITDVPRQQMLAGGSLKWTMEFGLALTGSFKMMKFSDHESLVTGSSADEKIIVPSEGTAKFYSLSGVLTLATYVTLEAAYNYSDRQLQVSDAASEQKILSGSWSQITETSLKLSLQYPF